MQKAIFLLQASKKFATLLTPPAEYQDRLSSP
jgi:hypothetical protein